MATNPPLLTRRWLHRHGIVRSLSSATIGYSDHIDCLYEASPWVPKSLIVWAARRRVQQVYPLAATRVHLTAVARHPTTLNGKRRWDLKYRPT